jgi:hypothetical protein
MTPSFDASVVTDAAQRQHRSRTGFFVDSVDGFTLVRVVISTKGFSWF